jgi:hypothetical protein
LYTANDGIILAKDIKKTDEIITDTKEGTFVVSKRTRETPIELFDIINAGAEHRYFANGILNGNCNFLGSQSTLISPECLGAMTHDDPIETTENFRMYARPMPGRKYFITVDVAEGIEEDASAFVVTDITEMPYTMVGAYTNDSIAPMLFPTPIVKIAELYNEAYILVELNARGAQVADIIHNNLEYSNLLMTAMRGRHGLILGQGFSNKCKLGLSINPGTKKLGCSNLKTLLEQNHYVVTDFLTISQLTTYVTNKTGSAAADHGSHDDLVACLVVFAWCISQPYFRELCDIDTTREVQQAFGDVGEFEILGGSSSVLDQKEIIDGNLIWKPAGVDSTDLFEYGEEISLWSYV